MRTKRIDQEMFDILTRQFQAGKGVSRHEVKQQGVFSAQTNMIHSKRTFQTYRQQCKAFCRYARETLGVRKLKDLSLTHVKAWLEERQNLGDSPYTLKTRAAALAKVLRCSSTDFGFDFPIRKSEDIKRSRGVVKMDFRLDRKKYADIITVAKGTGMRRVELQRLKPSQLEIRDGRAYVVNVRGKGDLVRAVPVLREYQGTVAAIFNKCETEKVFPNKIPTYIDVHSYRGEYAKAMYDEVLDYKVAKGEEVKLDYHTRGKVRISISRAVTAEVSLALGHKRVGVTVLHYLKHHFG